MANRTSWRKTWIFPPSKKYAEEVIVRFEILDTEKKEIPMSVSFTKKKAFNKDPFYPMQEPFSEAIGSLWYLAGSTRPDLVYAVAFLSRFSKEITREHWIAIRYVLGYLKQTSDYGLWFKHASQLDTSPCQAACDADYAGDKFGGKSTSGFLIFLFGAPVIWGSKLQSIPTLNSMESEYISASHTARLIVWQRMFLNELGFGDLMDDVTLFNDNKSMNIFADDVMINHKSRHIQVRYHYVRHCILKKWFTIKYLCTKNLPSDIMTKAVGGAGYKYKRGMIVLSMTEAKGEQ